MQTLTLQVPEGLYTQLKKRADQAHRSVEAEMLDLLAATVPAPKVEQATPRLEQRFGELVQQWQAATLFTSSTSEMVAHPAYQQIIAMGNAAVPLILAELRRDPDHWFPALKVITGEDPVPACDRGNLERMTHAWLDWAKRRGL